MGTAKTVNCPRCSAAVVWGPEARYRPFCSERCKTGDLGAWATEKYKVPAPSDEPGDIPEGDER